MGIFIRGTGSFVPDRVVTNADLEKMVDTSDEWIVTRTGIRERRIADADTATSDLAAEAGRRALENAGLQPSDIDLVVVTTITSDHQTPSTAPIVQHKLGIPPCMSFDLGAACSAFLYALNTVHAMVKSGEHRNALLIGADKLSCVTNWQDRSTCVLFGDAASAVVVSSDPAVDYDFLIDSEIGADGALAEILQIPGFGSACPATVENFKAHRQFITMNGPKTFQMAVQSMIRACTAVLERTHTSIDEIAWAIPHQANDRIICAVADRLGIKERIYRKAVERYGNTSSSSIGLCLDDLHRSGALKHGDKVLTAAFGAGLTWAAELLRW